ncbi:MAG: cytidylate kinase-like family protein [Bacteroidales bacterium]|nr:cytidylate kinase-like family protein [Bacteroidales bacterium]
MNKNILLQYMENRLNKVPEKKSLSKSGPVITISRETGCPAKRISKLLALTLNKIQKDKGISWKCVSKEILNESAKELNLNPSQIEYVFDYEQRGLLDEAILSLSTKYYKSDRKIRRTISEVIRTIAEQGNVIIIGRGSVVITHDMPNSFHINLQAPLEWRIDILCEQHDMTYREAKRYVKVTDKKREKFRNSFYGKNTDYTWFDLTFNCMSFTDEEIVNGIISMLEIRKLI